MERPREDEPVKAAKTTMYLGSVIIPVFAPDGHERTPDEAKALPRASTFDEDEPLAVERALDRYLVSPDQVPLMAARPRRRFRR